MAFPTVDLYLLISDGLIDILYLNLAMLANSAADDALGFPMLPTVSALIPGLVGGLFEFDIDSDICCDPLYDIYVFFIDCL